MTKPETVTAEVLRDIATCNGRASNVVGSDFDRAYGRLFDAGVEPSQYPAIIRAALRAFADLLQYSEWVEKDGAPAMTATGIERNIARHLRAGEEGGGDG